MSEPIFESIRPRTRRLGRRIIHLASVASTLEEGKRLAAAGAEDGTVIVADTQTKGRGRAGRSWHSPKGSLYATVLLRGGTTPDAPGWIPLGAGLSLARAIHRLTRLESRLKWPNDVWIDGKKVAGILVEATSEGSALRTVLVGLGVNGDIDPRAFPADLQATATSLRASAGRHVCLPALLKVFLEDYERVLGQLQSGNLAAIQTESWDRSALRDQRVRATMAGTTVEGVAVGLDPGGRLVLRTERGDVALDAAECELVRPAA